MSYNYYPSDTQRKNEVKSENPPLNPERKWNDLWAAILFYISFGTFLGLMIWNGIYFIKNVELGDFKIDGKSGFSYIEKTHVIGVLTAITVSSVSTIVYLKLLRGLPETMIKASYFVSFGIFVAQGIYFIMLHDIAGYFIGGFTLFFALLFLLFYFLWRNKIPFTALILSNITKVLKKHPGLILLNVAAVIVILFVVILAVFGEIGTVIKYNQQEFTKFEVQTIGVFTTFNLFWFSQVVGNTLLTTIAGVVGTFYFFHGTGQSVNNPTVKCLKQSLTYSFGSICFGSLILAIISTIQAIVQNNTDSNSLGGALANCFLNIIKDIAEYFNYYAYMQVALYGKPYIRAAKDTWALIKSHGVEAIINDNLINVTLFIMSFTISSIGALSAYGIVWLKEGHVVASIVYGVSFIISIIIPALITNIISSGATALFVCYAQNPEILAVNQPELYQEFVRRSHL